MRVGHVNFSSSFRGYFGQIFSLLFKLAVPCVCRIWLLDYRHFGRSRVGSLFYVLRYYTPLVSLRRAEHLILCDKDLIFLLLGAIFRFKRGLDFLCAFESLDFGGANHQPLGR